MTRAARHLGGPWLRLAAVAGILTALVLVVGTRSFVDGLRVVDATSAAAALGIGLVTTVLAALRWWLVARRVGLELRVADAVAENYRATFLNAVLPSGVLGDVSRAVRHGRSAGDLGRSARAVVLERTAGQVVVFALAAAVLPTQPELAAALLDAIGGVPVLVGVGAVGVAVGAIVLGRRHNHARPRVAGRAPDASGVSVGTGGAGTRGGGLVADLTGPGADRWRRWWAATVADLRAGVLARDTWPALLGLSAAALAGHLVLFLVAARAAGATAPAVELLPLLLLALMAMALPVSVGGWGPREGVAALVFWLAGLEAAQGVTVAVAYGALALIASLPGGVVMLVQHATRSRVTRPAVPPAEPGERMPADHADLDPGAEPRGHLITVPTQRTRPRTGPPPRSRAPDHLAPARRSR